MICLTSRYDVAVIGAGPAGASAARFCSAQGLRTILIEKHSIPRPKPCGGGVSLKALQLIDTPIPETLIHAYMKGFRVFSSSLKSIDLRSPDPIGISTTRDRFDAFLTKEAVQAGCTLIQANGLIAMQRREERITCRLRTGELVHTQLLIGADGANSVVAQQSGIRRKWMADEVGFCLETTLPLTKKAMKQIESDLFELYFLNIPLGYGWVFPKTSAISLGIGGVLAHLRKPQDILTNFCHTVAKLKHISLNISRFHAHLTPAGGFQRQLVTDRVILAGDAAGFIDPLTGEGIYYAIKSGQLAATACQQSIEHNDGTAPFLNAHYARNCEDAFEKDLRVALDLTYRIHKHFDPFFDTLKHSSSASWVDLVTGKANYRTLRRKIMPQLLLRLMKLKFKKLTF